MRSALIQALAFGVYPAWLLAGLADWWCHRRTAIAQTSGVRETLLHLLMVTQLGLAISAGLLLRINALVLALMLVLVLLHHLTAVLDTVHAASRRTITPLEQHVHSFLDLMPPVALAIVALLHLEQWQALFGLARVPADFALAWKDPPLPRTVIATVFISAALAAVLPYAEELRRGLRELRPASQSCRAETRRRDHP
jgi:hypothetical protein